LVHESKLWHGFRLQSQPSTSYLALSNPTTIVCGGGPFSQLRFPRAGLLTLPLVDDPRRSKGREVTGWVQVVVRASVSPEVPDAPRFKKRFPPPRFVTGMRRFFVGATPQSGRALTSGPDVARVAPHSGSLFGWPLHLAQSILEGSGVSSPPQKKRKRKRKRKVDEAELRWCR
jgi:hypothetical protein